MAKLSSAECSTKSDLEARRIELPTIATSQEIDSAFPSIVLLLRLGEPCSRIATNVRLEFMGLLSEMSVGTTLDFVHHAGACQGFERPGRMQENNLGIRRQARKACKRAALILQLVHGTISSSSIRNRKVPSRDK